MTSNPVSYTHLGLVAIADSKGNVKGYANNPQVDLPLNSKGKLDVATAVGIGVMSVILVSYTHLLMGVEHEEQSQSSLSYFLHQNYKLDAARLARGGGSDGGIQYQLLQLEVLDVQTVSEVEEFLRQLEQFMKIREIGRAHV